MINNLGWMFDGFRVKACFIAAFPNYSSDSSEDKVVNTATIGQIFFDPTRKTCNIARQFTSTQTNGYKTPIHLNYRT